MSGNELVQAGPQATALAEQYDSWTPTQVALIRSQLLGGEGSMDELSLLLHQAQRTGLDPLAKQIYGIFRWDSKTRTKKMTIQVGIDGFRSIAEQTGEIGGSKVYWCGKDGVWKDVWIGEGYPYAAKAVIYRKGAQEPFEATARWDEYVQTDKNGNVTRMWKQLSSTMLAKCAEALALRKAFPHKLSGLYTPEEMAQSDHGEELPGGVTMSHPAPPADPPPPTTTATVAPEPDDSKMNAGVERKVEVVTLPDPDSVEIRKIERKSKSKCAISGKPLGNVGDRFAYAQINGKHWMAREDEYNKLAAEQPVEAEFEEVPDKVNEEEAEGLTREALAGTPAGRLLDELAGPEAEEAPVAEGLDDDLPN